MKASPLTVETAVKQRYAAGAQAQDAALCCPVNYDPRYLEVIPQEVIERNYGCDDPSSALTEEGFLAAFERAGFYGIRLATRDEQPWQTVHGIEFRSVTVEAFKGKQGACFERNQAVIYKGPFKEVLDDDNHRLLRGQRHAVCDKTFQLYKKAPYRDHFEFVEPLAPVPVKEAAPFDYSRTAPRHPRETKGLAYDATTAAAECCDAGGAGCS